MNPPTAGTALRSGITATLLLVLASCGGEPSAPDEDIAAVQLRPHQLVHIAVGDTLRLFLSAQNARGNVASIRSPDFSMRWSGGGAGDVDALLLHAAQVPSSDWLVVETKSGARDSVYVVTYRPEGAFHITLQFADDIPERWRAKLSWAADRWEQTVAGELPAVTLASAGGDCPTVPDEPASPAQTGVETGMRIYIGQSGNYPPGTYVEATGGPCVSRPLPAPTTIIGHIILNRDKPIDGIDDVRLTYLALHEMGHTLGLVGVVQGVQPPWFDRDSGTYTGAMALEGWRRLFGNGPTSLHVDGGAHWKSDPLYDIMSAGGGGPGITGPISLATVGALMDLGYPATWSGAGIIQ